MWETIRRVLKFGNKIKEAAILNLKKKKKKKKEEEANFPIQKAKKPQQSAAKFEQR
jgi:hypothetical protein